MSSSHQYYNLHFQTCPECSGPAPSRRDEKGQNNASRSASEKWMPLNCDGGVSKDIADHRETLARVASSDLRGDPPRGETFGLVHA